MSLVPRRLMPQIDEKDLAELISCAFQQGHEPAFEVQHAEQLHSHQRVDHQRALSMPVELVHKPILVSADGFVLDGNHRWFKAKHDHVPLTVIKLALPFDDALAWLFSLHFVYHIDKTTLIRN